MLFQVNYFPSRFDPVRHAEKYPIPSAVLTGRREKVNCSFFLSLSFVSVLVCLVREVLLRALSLSLSSGLKLIC